MSGGILRTLKTGMRDRQMERRGRRDRQMRAWAASSGRRSGGLVAQRGQQPVEVFPARAASAQVRGDAGVALLHRIASGSQLDPWIPLMLFALLFGFSMDYQVFLLSRIREEWLGGASDSDAVANGLAATGRVITSAAAIMICVFAAFALGDLRVLRVIGLGMAVAIFFDATLVRMAAMPSALRLLGRASWWFPRWLDRAIPAFLAETRPELTPAASGHTAPHTAGRP
jgi:uncharacterized membrane protein YdfJ with MMPL/SSD domain